MLYWECAKLTGLRVGNVPEMLIYQGKRLKHIDLFIMHVDIYRSKTLVFQLKFVDPLPVLQKNSIVIDSILLSYQVQTSKSCLNASIIIAPISIVVYICLFIIFCKIF